MVSQNRFPKEQITWLYNILYKFLWYRGIGISKCTISYRIVEYCTENNLWEYSERNWVDNRGRMVGKESEPSLTVTWGSQKGLVLFMLRTATAVERFPPRKSLISFSSWESRGMLQAQCWVQRSQHSWVQAVPLNHACFIWAALGTSSSWFSFFPSLSMITNSSTALLRLGDRWSFSLYHLLPHH